MELFWILNQVLESAPPAGRDFPGPVRCQRCDASQYPYNSSPYAMSKSTFYHYRSLRLVAQDASLSRWRQGFDSPRDRHLFIFFNKLKLFLTAGHDHQLANIDVWRLFQGINNGRRNILGIQY